MIRSLIIIAALIFLSSCESAREEFLINGKLEGAVPDGAAVYLRKVDENNRPVDVDTTSIQAGSFSFTGVQKTPEVYYIFIDNSRGSIPVIVENTTIDIQAQKDSLFYAKVKGTRQNELFGEFFDAAKQMALRAQSMNQDMRDAVTNKDTSVMNSLREEYFELQQEAQDQEIEFVKANNDALVSVLIVSKLMATKALPDEEIKELFDALAPEVQQSNVGISIKTQLDKNKRSAIGSKAPNFSAPTPDGEKLALTDVLGSVTILDFWAAWCKPCRAENPNVVKLYDKYKDKGLSILGVSLDRRAEDWKKAIEDDGLEWHHVSNVRYFDEIAELYNVSAIPATFILDGNGVIVAKNLRGTELESKIAELLD
ncbi:MAG: TlpA disulfide reductase family protein [Flavobacteriaceae bacterium]